MEAGLLKESYLQLAYQLSIRVTSHEMMKDNFLFIFRFLCTRLPTSTQHQTSQAWITSTKMEFKTAETRWRMGKQTRGNRHGRAGPRCQDKKQRRWKSRLDCTGKTQVYVWRSRKLLHVCEHRGALVWRDEELWLRKRNVFQREACPSLCTGKKSLWRNLGKEKMWFFSHTTGLQSPLMYTNKSLHVLSGKNQA